MKYYIIAKKISKDHALFDEFLRKLKFQIKVNRQVLEQKKWRKGLILNEHKKAFTEYPSLLNCIVAAGRLYVLHDFFLLSLDVAYDL